MTTTPSPNRPNLKTLLVGKARDPLDRGVFHRLSLVAFFAWVGLGADGLSSSCYGPEEAFKAMGAYPHLTIFVALATALTVFVISTSYTQIIERFPAGGGGYVVASKLLSPKVGMISGCALILDYILTIAISIASGVDAMFSFLPLGWQELYPLGMPFKLLAVLVCLVGLTLLNLRGVKESVVPLVPIFLTFVLTHLFVVGSSLVARMSSVPQVIQHTQADLQGATQAVGWIGMVGLLLHAYSMGAGTYTGIEAVSNNLAILREPRVQTGKRTMSYMAVSLALMVLGLMLAYLLFRVEHVPGKTLNAVLFERFTATWPSSLGHSFIWVTLLSEAAILMIAAQAGFLGGPSVLSNMALDGWMPRRFATLSDRLVTENGILLMALFAGLTLLLTRGSVGTLVVLYSINVFITFVLSQAGMVRLWWHERLQPLAHWKKGIVINGTGLVLCLFILVSIVWIKFHEGGWVTLLVTGLFVLAAVGIQRHYRNTAKVLRRLDSLVAVADSTMASQTADQPQAPEPPYDPTGKTAAVLVGGYNGIGLHTVLNVVRLFPGSFKNFVFISVGIIDAGNFKGANELSHLQEHVKTQVDKYVHFAQRQGFHAQAFTAMGMDVVAEVANLAPRILEQYPDTVFFGGQLVFNNETMLTRLLHNYTVFALQRRFYQEGIPVVVLPIRL
ncbi:MAG: APC family permease [Phycisphaeraceae bacterium]|nr:APC family permease [Phycisphaeraceae bacterium]